MGERVFSKKRGRLCREILNTVVIVLPLAVCRRLKSREIAIVLRNSAYVHLRPCVASQRDFVRVILLQDAGRNITQFTRAQSECLDLLREAILSRKPVTLNLRKRPVHALVLALPQASCTL